MLAIPNTKVYSFRRKLERNIKIEYTVVEVEPTPSLCPIRARISQRGRFFV